MAEIRERINKKWDDYQKTYLTPAEKILVAETEVNKRIADIYFAQIETILQENRTSNSELKLRHLLNNELFENISPLQNSINSLLSLQTNEAKNLKTVTESINNKVISLVLLIILLSIITLWSYRRNQKLQDLILFLANKRTKEISLSEEKFRSLFQNMNIGYILYELKFNDLKSSYDLIIVEINDKALSNFNLNRTEAIGLSMCETDDYFNLYDYEQAVNIANNGGKTTYEKTINKPLNHTRITIYCPLKNRVALILEDITQSRANEIATKKSEQMYHGLFEHIASGFILVEVITDEEGNPFDHRLLQANPEFEKQTGLDRNKEIGKTSAQLSFQWPVEIVQKYYNIALNRGSFEHVIYNESLKRHFEIRCFSPSQGLFALLFHDITERTIIEEKLKKSESKYRRLHESMTDGFVLVEMEGAIIEYNKAYKEMLGYTDKELNKLSYTDITPIQWHPSETNIVENQVLIREFSDVYEKEYRKKDGTIFPVELKTFLLKMKRVKTRECGQSFAI